MTAPRRPPVRVLWLIKGLGPGGAEQLLVNQAAAGDHRAVRYDVAYVVPWKDHHVAPLAELGVTAHCLGSGTGGERTWLVALRALLSRERFDVVHTHSPLLAAGVRLLRPTLPAARRPALVTTEHNRWPRHRWPTRLANLVTFPLDDVHLSVSDDVRDTVPARLRSGVQTLVHGTDVAGVQAQADRAGVREELGVGDDEVVIGTVANLRREKNYELLLRSAAHALAEPPPGAPPLRFVSVGQGPLEEEIRALHSSLGLGDRFLLLGYRPDAVRVMSSYDVFTLSSTHEGLPVSLMDAFALGLPVVATAVGGIPEAVSEGAEGLLVPSGDAHALVAAWWRVATDPALRRAFGEAAAVSSARFDAANATKQLEDLYCSLAVARDGGTPSSA